MLLSIHALRAADRVRTAPAPQGEPLSTQFKVSVEQTNVPVYLARVCSLSAEERKHLGPSLENQTTTTSFASFDLGGPARVNVACTDEVKNVTVLPSARGLRATIIGKTFSFTVDKPGPLTIEVNGDAIHALHLFVDPVEKDQPNPTDPNVVYFGPGVHHVQSVAVNSGQTVYVAAGAVVYGDGGGDNPKAPIFRLQGSNITLRGRGIIDCSLCPLHTRSIVGVTGSHIRMEGVTLRDSSGFTLPVRRSDDVKIDNVKVFGWRGNSDGMDICNSRQVEITGCFLRTFDDLIVLKTDKGQGELRDVTVKNCVLWNEFAHALSLGAELREPLTNVLFSDCDIIRDKGREWLLRVYHCDAAPVKNVTFERIRIEESRRLMSVWIGKAVWSKQDERGHVDGVTFRNIQSAAPAVGGPLADLVGFDAEHAVHGVRFENVTVGNRPLKQGDVRQNPFVSDVSVSP
ncbi:MAG TPA: glycosyl hydrolase family 28 protein [Chthoniobacter sp.]|nr:glycosyl hydrolase family 28 protein [Chthoniobacter sp.]